MFLDLLFPKHCIQCNKAGTYLCPICKNQIVRHNQSCIVCHKYAPFGKTHPKCQTSTPLAGIIIATQYKNVVKKAIHVVKYKLTYDILTEILNNTLISEKITQCLQTEQINLCTEIPLHKYKYNQRGFNQSQLICKWIEKNYRIPYQQTIIKEKQTQSQVALQRNDRLFNLQNAFSLNPKSIDLIQNKNILLVDDVTTTGSTLEEAAKILLKNGANKIWGLTLASRR
jgi:competence protein ComFC